LVPIGLQSEPVASIVPQHVFSEIRLVARSHAPLAERRVEAASRVTQFKADLAVAGLQPRVSEHQIESLRRTLQRAATHHDLSADENNIYAVALDVLIGRTH